jgi:8-oxo-dGTP pyrophosphatase MutT (NUDIX family)
MKPDWMKPASPPWKAGAPSRVHDNPYFAIDVYQATAPTGVETDYFAQNFKNRATGVVALDDQGRIYLVGQWRFPAGVYSWELPEGGVPPHEAVIEGAKRELREEAGLVARDWRSILVMHLSNASSDEVAEIFLATGLSGAPVDPDPTEALAIACVPFAEALDLALRGEIFDSLTVAALLRTHHMAVTGELADDLARAVLSSRGP